MLKMSHFSYVTFVFVAFQLCICINLSVSETPQQWRDIAKKELDKVLATKHIIKRPKNVIIFLGDGMGISTLTAARIYKGQLFNTSGEEGSLVFEQFPFTGLSKTYNDDAQVADSAGAATAFFCGEKSRRGVLGVNSNAVLGDCASATGNHITSILEWAQDAGKATGIVTTSRITHATPAALFAHSPHRDWEVDSEIPEEQGACRDITWQLVMDKPGKDVKVLFGGGRRNFLPNDTSDYHTLNVTGMRKDGRNMMNLWKGQREAEGRKATVVTDRNQLNNLNVATTEHVLGVFAYSHFEMDLQRERLAPEQPTITEMTTKAVEILRKEEKGLFLAVEGGRIDHGHHEGRAKLALHDTVAFDNAIEATMKMLTAEELAETLIVVTADHSHTFTFGGKPKRGNPILKFGGHNNTELPDHLSGENSAWPYTSLAYANGPGGALWFQRGNLSQADPPTDHEDFYQDSAVPLKSETHGGEDVAIYATGPFAHLMVGLHEQHYIPVAIDYAACYRSQEPAHCKNSGFGRYGTLLLGKLQLGLILIFLEAMTVK